MHAAGRFMATAPPKGCTLPNLWDVDMNAMDHLKGDKQRG